MNTFGCIVMGVLEFVENRINEANRKSELKARQDWFAERRARTDQWRVSAQKRCDKINRANGVKGY